MDSESSDFIPEVELDASTGETVDVRTRKKPVKIFIQKPHEPLSDYGG